jgi:phenylalanyl-tRNA synthetase beta chain
VMLELGKPIHTYDATGVAADDGVRRLIVRRAEAGERIETLDHVERTLDADTLLIADSRGPVGIAGVMGDAASEVSDETTDVIIESAIFDPITIRRTGQRYGLRSEASLRFEKGVENRLARLGADRTARLINEWAGGTVATGRVDTAPDEPEPARVPFRPARVNRLLGTTLSGDELRELLARVGIETIAVDETTVPIATGAQPLTIDAGPGEALVAVVPTWRRDVAIEADVAEEVARVHGYEEIPSILPDTPMPPYRPQPLAIRDTIRETLAGAGVTEVISHALVSPALAEAFRWESELPRIDAGSPAGGRPITAVNPLSTEHSVLRPGLIGSLVEVVSTNLRHGTTDVAIFEIGKGYGFEPGAPDREIREWTRVAIAATGNRTMVAWNQPAETWALDDVKGLIELVGRRLGIEPPDYSPVRGEPLLHPGRAGSFQGRRDGTLEMAGWVGELHPGLAAEWDLRGARTIVAEMDIAGLEGGVERAVRALAPPRHPPVERDLAVVVAEDQAAGAVAGAIRAAAGSGLESIVLFDVYRGAPLNADEKSLAFRLTFPAGDQPLAESDLDAAIEAITARIAADVGGRIRT